MLHTIIMGNLESFVQHGQILKTKFLQVKTVPRVIGRLFSWTSRLHLGQNLLQRFSWPMQLAGHNCNDVMSHHNYVSILHCMFMSVLESCKDPGWSETCDYWFQQRHTQMPIGSLPEINHSGWTQQFETGRQINYSFSQSGFGVILTD